MKDEDKTKEQLKSDHDKSVKVLEQTCPIGKRA